MTKHNRKSNNTTRKAQKGQNGKIKKQQRPPAPRRIIQRRNPIATTIPNIRVCDALSAQIDATRLQKIKESAEDTYKSLENHPSLSKLVRNSDEALQSITQDYINGSLSSPKYNQIMWLLGHNKKDPESGKLGYLDIEKNVVTGRPGFSKNVNESFEHIGGTARRHLIAWHTIKKSINVYIEKKGKSDLSEYIWNNIRTSFTSYPEHLRNDILLILSKFSKPLKDAFDDGSIINVFNGGLDKTIVSEDGAIKLGLFIMNSCTANLWIGDGNINSSLPAWSNKMYKIPKDPQEFIDTYQESDGKYGNISKFYYEIIKDMVNDGNLSDAKKEMSNFSKIFEMDVFANTKEEWQALEHTKDTQKIAGKIYDELYVGNDLKEETVEQMINHLMHPNNHVSRK